MNVHLSAYSIAFCSFSPITGCVGQDDSANSDDGVIFDCVNGNQVLVSVVNDGVNDCGDYSDEEEHDLQEVEDVNLPVITNVPNQLGCDNLNPHHCMSISIGSIPN